MNQNLRVIFLGTPDFAVTPLKALVDAGVNIVAVVTAPDKPAGRGMQLQQPPVKKYAVENNIPVLQPIKLKSPEFLAELKSYQADLQVVIAFRMLPEAVWNMPRLGTINLHASLLPDYRGAAPINWAIINGETETGVSTFLLKHEIDTGDIIISKTVKIGTETTAGELHDDLMYVGAALIVETVKAVERGNYTTTPQKNASNKIAPKLFTTNCEINWTQTGAQVKNLIRGLSPYPGAFTKLKDQVLKVYNCRFDAEIHNETLGTMQSNYEKNSYIRFAVADGWIYPTDVQLQGKKRMKTEDLLRGWRN